MGTTLAFVGAVKGHVNLRSVNNPFPTLTEREEKNMLFLQHKVPDFQHIESGLSWSCLQ